MPRYEYKCDGCEKILQIFHLLDEDPGVCTSCGSAEIKKSFNTPVALSIKRERSRKVGELVEEYIQESRESLEKEKTEIDKKR
tara:strand:+ start:645 stop:893 length:249 start_codon:yes stop_codon:yes gene_type:complete